MISTPHRQTATMLIEDAVTAGVQRAKAWRCWIDPAWFDSEAFRSEQDVVNAAHV
jgi:hypothetical protein